MMVARQQIYGSVRVGGGGVMCGGGVEDLGFRDSVFSFLCECGGREKRMK